MGFFVDLGQKRSQGKYCEYQKWSTAMNGPTASADTTQTALDVVLSESSLRDLEPSPPAKAANLVTGLIHRMFAGGAHRASADQFAATEWQKTVWQDTKSPQSEP
ncbi:MAG: hypothetical protein KA185_09260 [Vitreoscilla sp.]|nr:hypothetical protein [Vitreoscilla sp.]